MDVLIALILALATCNLISHSGFGKQPPELLGSLLVAHLSQDVNWLGFGGQRG
jgi:hypothetical protein